MEKKQRLAKITTEFMVQVQNLQELLGQASQLGSRIAEMTGKLGKIDHDLEVMERFPVNTSNKEPAGIESREKNGLQFNVPTGGPSNILSFPGTNLFGAAGTRIKRFLALPFLAVPGKSLPVDIPDFRPFLQRDGLILLAWDKRMTETGESYTAYWVTSIGTPRFYASGSHTAEDFFLARPDRKSYAAEDGIEFYGQDAPVYLVHVAPELMMSNPQHRELRLTHIKALKRCGSEVDFDYRYLLTEEKKRNLPLKKSAGSPRRNTPTESPA